MENLEILKAFTKTEIIKINDEEFTIEWLLTDGNNSFVFNESISEPSFSGKVNRTIDFDIQVTSNVRSTIYQYFSTIKYPDSQEEFKGKIEKIMDFIIENLKKMKSNPDFFELFLQDNGFKLRIQ